MGKIVENIKLGHWCNVNRHTEDDIKKFATEFDIIMVSSGAVNNIEGLWDNWLSDCEKWISLNFTYRPNGENKDDVAISIDTKVIREYEASKYYIDEPFRKRDINNIPKQRVSEILNDYQKLINDRYGKHLNYGEGWRYYENEKFNQVAWTYYSTWIKFLWWWIKIPSIETLNSYGRKNIRDMAKHGLSHIWVHAEREWQFRKLIKLATEFNVPLILYVSSKANREDSLKLVENFLDKIKKL